MLLSSSKLVLQRALEESIVVDDPVLEEMLFAAFPPQMRERFAEDIAHHRLRRELIATKLANRIVNDLGPVHPFELVEEEGCSLAQVAAAFVVAERLLDLKGVWALLDGADGEAMPEQVRLTLYGRIAEAQRGHIADVLRASHGSLTPGALIAELTAGVTALSAATGELLQGEAKVQARRLLLELAEAGASPEAAQRIAHLVDMDGAIGLAHLAGAQGIDPLALTAAFSALGTALGLDWAQQAASRMSPSDPWERLLVAGLARDFQQMRLDFLARARGGDPGGHVAAWLDAQAAPVRNFRALTGRAQATAAVAPAMLAQLASQARTLLAR
jgi:glutamate dehydrogenase